MCDSFTADLICGIVNELTDENLMFSAYDITKILRDRGHSVFHRDVRSEVHRMLGNDEIPNYVKLMHSFEDHDGNTISAFVFMPDGNYVGDYDAKALPDALQNAPKTNPNPTRTKNSPLDARGRLWVPKDALSWLGVNSGDKVYIYERSELIIIEAQEKEQETAEVVYTVDSDGLIAISNKYLVESELDKCSSLVFEHDGDELLIEPG
jgi:bifunctional DNA-binding transcriptional regulator/antitoxin component of YhaV-PrlF toxin-antitoxin module